MKFTIRAVSRETGEVSYSQVEASGPDDALEKASSDQHEISIIEDSRSQESKPKRKLSELSLTCFFAAISIPALLLFVLLPSDSFPTGNSHFRSKESAPVLSETDARESLARFYEACNFRIPMLEANTSNPKLKLIPQGFKLTEEAEKGTFHDYAEVAVIVRHAGSERRFTEYYFEFDISRFKGGEWEFLTCFGRPKGGIGKMWTLASLAGNKEGQLAMDWLVGREKSETMLRPAFDEFRRENGIGN